MKNFVFVVKRKDDLGNKFENVMVSEGTDRLIAQENLDDKVEKANLSFQHKETRPVRILKVDYIGPRTYEFVDMAKRKIQKNKKISQNFQKSHKLCFWDFVL